MPTGAPDDVTHVVDSSRPIDLRLTLGRLARGPQDPTFATPGPNEIWRTGRFPAGPVTYRLLRTAPAQVVATAWGPGSADFLASLPGLLGEADDATGFVPPPRLREVHRRAVGLRIGRTGRVLEALIPAILEQRVQTVAAQRSWAWLLRRHGEAAPGPVAARLRVAPDAATWAGIPSWDYHRAGVDPARARTIVTAARAARRLEEAARLPSAAARARLRAVPGVGAWTAAQVAARAFGDADAVPVGDYHLAELVGWGLLGAPIDDAEVDAALAPYAPHRYRVIRLLEIAGAGAPRRGPRLPIADHRGR